jgi:dihydroflavonol-4-reductase
MPRDLSGTTIALTGATGFVGRHLVEELLRRGARVRALARSSPRVEWLRSRGVDCRIASLDSPDELARALGDCEFAFHVAGAVDFGADWERIRRINVNGTIHTLDAARRAGVRRVVHTSSIVAIGATRRPRILDESAAWNLERSRLPYVTTKHEAEQEALARSDARMEVVVVNPACVIGPNDIDSSEFGTLCKRFWKGRIPIYFGGGNNFVDVRDVADGHIRALLDGRPGERYFLGGENLTYGDFFRLLADVSGYSPFRARLPSAIAPFLAKLETWFKKSSSKPNLPPARARLMGFHFFASSAKAARELGYQPRRVRESLLDAYRYWFPAAAA